MTPPAGESPCYRLPVSGSPRALEVTLNDGVPVCDLVIGQLETGQDAAIRFSSAAGLDELASAIRVARARLVMWHEDHRNPFEVAA